MATLEMRPGRPLPYTVRFSKPGGGQGRKSFRTKAEAKAFAATCEADKLRGTYVEPSRITVTGLARKWAELRYHRPGTAARTQSLIKNHIEPTPLGRRRVGDVRESEVRAWAKDRATVLAPSSLRGLVDLLRSMFGDAVLDRLCASNPVPPTRRLNLPRAERERIVPLTVEEVRALADAAPARYRAMIVAQAGLGLRIGELLGLRVEDVDFLRRQVRVERQFTAGAKETSAPKTSTSKRTIPLPSFVAEELAAHLAEFPAAGGWLFTVPAGTPVQHCGHGRMFAKAVAAAGLPEGTTSHDLRHHFASTLLHAGESVVTVAGLLGHDDGGALLLAAYAHILPNAEDRARATLEAAWAAPAAPGCPNPAPAAGQAALS